MIFFFCFFVVEGSCLFEAVFILLVLHFCRILCSRFKLDEFICGNKEVVMIQLIIE